MLFGLRSTCNFQWQYFHQTILHKVLEKAMELSSMMQPSDAPKPKVKKKILLYTFFRIMFKIYINEHTFLNSSHSSFVKLKVFV
ncbi:hypothetical protein Hanom_Chr07g00610471 [Helianthus anomalus]